MELKKYDVYLPTTHKCDWVMSLSINVEKVSKKIIGLYLPDTPLV